MREMQVAVVMPVGQGRLPNVVAVLDSLAKQTMRPRIVVLVCDGPEAHIELQQGLYQLPLAILATPAKHQPGMEQPRNVGARLIDDLGDRDKRFAGITHVWFVDSDVIMRPRCLEFFQQAYAQAEAWRCPDCGTPKSAKLAERGTCDQCGFSGEHWKPAHSIFVGPYDWLPKGQREPDYELRNDPDGVQPPGRWDRFDNHEPDTPVVNDVYSGLACFGGNLIWPLEEFKRVGGFWDELHHGRCEDGELGVRAVAMGVPITFVREARGWHLWHPRNMQWIMGANARDVPMLDDRHPVLKRCTCGHPHDAHAKEEEGGACRVENCDCTNFQRELLVVDEDGKRFNYRCPECGDEMNAALSWGHRAQHDRQRMEGASSGAAKPGHP